MNSHGRALFTLVHRAMAGHGHTTSPTANGGSQHCCRLNWRRHCNKQQLKSDATAVRFQPGEVRVVLLDAQPIHRQTQGVPADRGKLERHVRGRHGETANSDDASIRSRASAVVSSPRRTLPGGGDHVVQRTSPVDIAGLQSASVGPTLGRHRAQRGPQRAIPSEVHPKSE